MLKQKLLKRVLPVILSVAMAFEMMPAAASAAEYGKDGTVGKTELEENESGGAETEGVDVQGENRTEAVLKESGTSQETEESIAAEEKAETIAEEESQTHSEEKETSVAKIVIDDRKADEFAEENNGFTRRLGEEGLVFFTEYVEEGKCGELQEAVKDWIDIEVDGERVNTLKDRLTYNWVKKAESGEGTDTPLDNRLPEDAGEYELTISMDLTRLDGICKNLESDAKLFLTIEKADIELAFGCEVVPGKTAGEFIDEVNEGYTIKYKNRPYNVSRDIFAIKDAAGKEDPDKKLPLHIFRIDENGARQPMEMTDRFDRTRDYVMTIDGIALTENGVRNYKLSVKDSYAITVGQRQKTAVRFERKDSGEDLIRVYDPAKKWTAAEVTEGLFKEPAADGALTKAGGAPAVYIHGKDDREGEYSVLLEGAEPKADWYTRIRLKDGVLYNADEEAGEIVAAPYVYKPMASDPGDAGEYFIIWSYAGDDSAYEKSHSEAVRFTIDPAPIAVKASQESVDQAGFCDGMTGDEVRKALAKLSYGVYPLVKNETTGAMEV